MGYSVRCTAIDATNPAVGKTKTIIMEDTVDQITRRARYLRIL